MENKNKINSASDLRKEYFSLWERFIYCIACWNWVSFIWKFFLKKNDKNERILFGKETFELFKRNGNGLPLNFIESFLASLKDLPNTKAIMEKDFTKLNEAGLKVLNKHFQNYPAIKNECDRINSAIAQFNDEKERCTHCTYQNNEDRVEHMNYISDGIYPNTRVNLKEIDTTKEFVFDIRNDASLDIVIMFFTGIPKQMLLKEEQLDSELSDEVQPDNEEFGESKKEFENRKSTAAAVYGGDRKLKMNFIKDKLKAEIQESEKHPFKMKLLQYQALKNAEESQKKNNKRI